MSITKFYLPKDIAAMLGIDVGKVGGFIATGELQAINVARKAGGRPRWRISDDQLRQFLAARSTNPPVKLATRRRKPQAVTEYY